MGRDCTRVIPRAEGFTARAARHAAGLRVARSAAVRATLGFAPHIARSPHTRAAGDARRAVPRTATSNAHVREGGELRHRRSSPSHLSPGVLCILVLSCTFSAEPLLQCAGCVIGESSCCTHATVVQGPTVEAARSTTLHGEPVKRNGERGGAVAGRAHTVRARKCTGGDRGVRAPRPRAFELGVQPRAAANPRQHALVPPFQTLINPTTCGRGSRSAQRKGPSWRSRRWCLERCSRASLVRRT